MSPYRTPAPRPAPSLWASVRRWLFVEAPSGTAHAASQALAVVVLCAAAAAATAAIVVACTPADRAKASVVISTLGPALCASLSPLLGENGAVAGLVCADLSKALGAGLLFARAQRGDRILPTERVVGSFPSCTWISVVSVDPSRDPREGVCAEAFGGDASAADAIRSALATGHAR